jgi:hypothetical protein
MSDPAPNLEVPRVPLEAVQLCIDNAYRLVDDSQDLSEPTAAALLELALEEVGKAWVLMVRLSDVGTGVLSPEEFFKQALGEKISRRYRRYSRKSGEYFQREVRAKAPSLEETFAAPGTKGSHKKKLEFVGRLLAWHRILLSAPPDPAVERSLSKFLISPAVRPTTGSKGTEPILDLLDQFDEKLLPSLTAIKEGGFYVDRTRGGSYVSPTSLTLPDIDDLEAIVRLLLTTLQLVFTSLVKVTGHREERQQR